LKRKHRGYGDTFYIDEVFVRINGKQHYLWRAVDQDGEVVDVYLQAKRDGAAAKRFFRRLPRSHGGEPRKIVTAVCQHSSSVRITLANAYAPVYHSAGTLLWAASVTTLWAAPEVIDPVTPPRASAGFKLRILRLKRPRQGAPLNSPAACYVPRVDLQQLSNHPGISRYT
jgi:hypothetical protein